MLIKKSTGLVLAGMLLLVVGVVSLVAQEQEEIVTQEKQFKNAPIPYSNPQSGGQMYVDYCAVCHGPGGKGDGSSAAFLKTWPPDLTRLARHNNGKYPELKVRGTLLFGTNGHAHGTSDMPVWGTLFQTLDGHKGHKEANARVSALNVYVESLQLE